jgi:hypothetical protein
MNASAFLAVFPRQLRFWTFHCSLNALPSFGIALLFLQLWKSPVAVAAMLSAITTFILLYTIVTSLSGPLSDEKHLLSRSLKLGAKIRGWISGTSVILLVTGKGIFFVPDLWCGMLAINVLNRIASLSGASSSSPFRPRPIHDIEGFFRIYAITMTEGFILSFILVMISFFAVMAVQARDRKRIFAVASPL